MSMRMCGRRHARHNRLWQRMVTLKKKATGALHFRPRGGGSVFLVPKMRTPSLHPRLLTSTSVTAGSMIRMVQSMIRRSKSAYWLSAAHSINSWPPWTQAARRLFVIDDETGTPSRAPPDYHDCPQRAASALRLPRRGLAKAYVASYHHPSTGPRSLLRGSAAPHRARTKYRHTPALERGRQIVAPPHARSARFHNLHAINPA